MNRPTATTASILFAALAAVIVSCSSGVGSAPLVTREPIDEPSPASPSGSVAPSPTASAEPSESAEPSTPGGSAAPGTPTAQPTATAKATDGPPAGSTEAMESVAYFLMEDPLGETNPTLVPVGRAVPKTLGVGRAALTELLAGTYGEPGLSTAIPEGTVLLGLEIEDGLATVDLSREFESGGGSFSMGARLAQVVYTLTRFPTVERVAFELDGEPVTVFSGEGLVLDGPVTRDDYLDYLPAILVDSPAWGGRAESPLTVEGISNVFEAQFFVGVFDEAGNQLAEQSVMATCGSGCWGTFSQELRLPAEATRRQLHLRVWEPSAKDGRPTNVRDYLITID